MPKTIKEIAARVQGELIGNGDGVIRGINGIQEAQEGDIAFIVNAQYEDLIDVTKASCVVVSKDVKKISKNPLIKVDHPSLVLSRIVELLLPDKRHINWKRR